MKNPLLIPALALCASCGALGTGVDMVGATLSSAGDTITTLNDPTSTPEEKAAAVEETAGYLGYGVEGDAAAGIAGLVAAFFAARRLKGKGGDAESKA